MKEKKHLQACLKKSFRTTVGWAHFLLMKEHIIVKSDFK